MSMDSKTKRRLLLGFITNWIGRLASTIIQLVQVPVFLHFWGVPLFGEWMIVTAIPNNLSFTNVGFGTVAGNEMTMMVARNDRESALRVFQSCWWLITLICSVTILLLSGALFTMGAVGFLVRRNPLVIFMCIELMLNAVNLAFAALSRYLNSLDGVVFAFLVITVAAAEVVVGIAIIVQVYRAGRQMDVDGLDLMKE